MKKILLICLCVVTTSITADNNDETRIRMRPQDRFVLDLFIDLWQNVPEDEMNLKFFNRGVNLAIMQDIPLGYTNISLAPGLGFSSHNMYSDNWYNYSKSIDGFNFTPIDENLDYDKNKINLNYINIPLELRFRTRPTQRMPNALRFVVGAKLGYMIQAHTKYEGDYYINDDPGNVRNAKFKEHNLNNIEKWQYGIIGRIGYGTYLNFNIYYPLTNIFKEGSNAKDIYPVSLGLSIIIN